ncbi:hypothetical protein P7K49_006828 [Saguinus oedipus]|uniref:GST N-terminal domain-containing protein n=1 Tax=Saguinus oedipus TaxID=9490 RepID=A0ABQ9W3H7_SAGOE|nr:hypothetical protein P7K49_006828 [Saguinus oedipus]
MAQCTVNAGLKGPLASHQRGGLWAQRSSLSASAVISQGISARTAKTLLNHLLVPTHLLLTANEAFKALIAVQYSRAQVCSLSALPHFHSGQTNSTPEFFRKFPAAKLPAFENNDGFCVFESNDIAYSVSNEEPWGSTPEAAAQVAEWVSSADSYAVPPASTSVFPIWASCTTTNRLLRMQRRR